MPNRRDRSTWGDTPYQQGQRNAAMEAMKKAQQGMLPYQGGGGGGGWVGDARDAMSKLMSTYAGGSAPSGIGKKVGPGLAATEADAAYLAHQERLKAMEEAERRRRQQSMYDAWKGMGSGGYGSAGYGGGGGGGGWPGWQGKWWQRFFE